MIFLASPYTDSDINVQESRYLHAVKAVGYAASRGKVNNIYSPIVHWHHVAKMYHFPTTFGFYFGISTDMIKLSSAFWVLAIDGWDTSGGIKAEYVVAKALRKPVTFLEPTTKGEYKNYEPSASQLDRLVL